jgi:tetratricopeptide (TPR) repeat protein
VKMCLRAVLFFLLAGLAGPLYAQGEVEFSQGVSLYKKEKYSAALSSFAAAEKAGMKEPKLYFNLALCHLQLNQFDQAKRYFLLAAAHKPLADLAHFNIALLELRRSDRDEARRWFVEVQERASSSKLRELAAQRLVQLEQSPSSVVSPVIWDSGYRLHLGYDDHIQDPALLGVTDRGDSFASAMIYAARGEGGNEGVRLGLVGYMQHYKSVSIYDLNLLQLSLDKGFLLADWHNRVGVELEGATLGRRNYLQTSKMFVSGKLPFSAMDDLRLRYRYSAVSAMTASYDYLAGNRHELEFRWRHKRQDMNLQASYELELNDRHDYQGATVFSSYSPTRHTVDMRAEVIMNPKWELDSRLTWRMSEYNDENVLADSSRIKRSDERLVLALGVNHPLSDKMKVGFEYKFTENHSNMATYHYTRNIYTIGLSGSF